MNSRQFLYIGGAILLLLGIVGFIAPNIGGSVLFLDVYENYAHTGLGIVAIAFAAWGSERVMNWVTVLVGIIALGFSIAGFAVAGRTAPNFFGANLENPAENVLHLVVGVWALLAAYLGTRKGQARMEEMKERMKKAA